MFSAVWGTQRAHLENQEVKHYLLGEQSKVSSLHQQPSLPKLMMPEGILGPAGAGAREGTWIVIGPVCEIPWRGRQVLGSKEGLGDPPGRSHAHPHKGNYRKRSLIGRRGTPPANSPTSPEKEASLNTCPNQTKTGSIQPGQDPPDFLGLLPPPAPFPKCEKLQ